MVIAVVNIQRVIFNISVFALDIHSHVCRLFVKVLVYGFHQIMSYHYSNGTQPE